MREEQARFWIWLALGPLTLAGCFAQAEEAPENVSISTSALEAGNSLSENGLGSNGLGSNGLGSNGLSANGLGSNGLIMSALNDAATGALNQQFLSYVVSCALPQGASISINVNGTMKQFDGQLGLAPQWGSSDNATCDVDCQQWVSACLIARVNAKGHHIALSMRGSHPALALTAGELGNYPRAEATYFGNIFSSNPQRYACKMPGSTLINRVCGDPDTSGNYPSCVANVLGTCDSTLCDAYVGGTSRYYAGCHPAGQAPYQTITVYRQPSDQDNPYPEGT